MSRIPFALLFVFSLCFASGCGRAGRAATLPDGSKITVLIVADRGHAPESPPERRKQLNQLLGWMEEDLTELLERIGYLAAPCADPSVRAKANRYLLHLNVTHYQGAHRGARMFGGGAPMAELKTHFELIGPGDAVLTSGDPSVAAAPDWTKAARAVNKQIRDAVNGRLRLAH